MKRLFSFKTETTYNMAALRVTLIYAVFSLLWILFSDQILLFLVKNAEISTKIQMIKGWAFVVVTSFIIYVLLLREIIKVQQAEKKIHEGEKKYLEIFNATTEAIFIYNVETGTIFDWNQSMMDISGFSNDEILKLTLNDLFFDNQPYSQKEALNYVRKAIECGPQLFEWRSRRKNGESFWAEVALRLSDIVGQSSIIVVVRDITERKMAEGVLHRKNRSLKLLSELTRVTVDAIDEKELLKDTCRILVDYGGYLLAWVGFARHDDDKNIDPVAQHGYEDSFLENLSIPWGNDGKAKGLAGEAIRRRAPVVGNDIMNDSKFCQWRGAAIEKGYISSISIPLLDENTCIGALNIYSKVSNIFDDEEITLLSEISSELLFGIKNIRTHIEKQQMEQANTEIEKQLSQTQKMEAIGTLAGGIAHDFNNILSVIIGYSELAKDTRAPESDLLEYMDAVLQAGHRAKDLVDQILVFSRHAQVERIPLKPQPIVREALKMLRSSIPSTIEIIDKIQKDCGLINADPTQLHQVVMNLCTNAFHAMEKTGGVLTVELKTADIIPAELLKKDAPSQSFIELIISDTGCGIAPELIDNIFDPFFTTKEKGKGTGMGLSITYGILKKYGGSISVESDPGKSTNFHLFFPKNEHGSEGEELTTENISGGTERILFVDDEAIIATMGKEILESLGYSVVARNSSVEALELFEEQPDQFDLVVTDQTMPGITGVDLALRMLNIRPDIPIILCTGYSNLIDENTAKSLGIRDLVYKPITRGEIAQSVRNILD
jgi:PAS domain S-box-containing protein